jgi:hypothetical protein
MELVQKGGTLLETEDAFFEWLNKDSNIEDLLKSTLAFLDYKKQTADKLIKETYKELDEFWTNSVVSRVRTQKAVSDSFNSAMKKIDPKSQEYSDVFLTGTKIERDTKGVSEEVTQVNKLASGINQTQQLNTLYEKQRLYICQTYFAKKSKPDEYKKALEQKRQAIRKVVNQFIEAFTGDSNRRHRLYILNYAIDFAQNWTSFQGNYKLNLIITGGAGLGKTTFAKAIGKIFFEFGLLTRDIFQIREKTDFIGQYIGQTPTKTYPVLYGALESMLFIDEAYSVSGCGSSTGFDYGQEFIDALVDVSQKTRGLISVIAAGYKAEMHSCFLDKNPGMRRRFPNEIELTPYSIIDLDNILTNNVLRPIFPKQLDTILKLDILKEPEIYFQKPEKFREFGNEILNRLPEIDPGHSMDPSIYTNLVSDANRASALQAIAVTTIKDYKTIIRFRTKIIGLYRFFLQLASFDTNYASFETMYSAHQYLWNLFTGSDTKRSYKYNNYRLMHILYLSSQQQKREIIKSYLLRSYFSEKEGSLFPNQAGDMDTLAGFIKSQPNIRENTLPSLEEVVKLFNEYFRTRGGSKFMLRATKEGEAIDLFIYHIGGGFITYTDFEGSVLTKLFKSLTYDQEDISALWKLGSIPPEQRTKIIQNINKLYSQACVQLLRDAHESLKSHDSKEKNEKRLPSGIDIRFLEAEVNSYMSANQGSELGDADTMKFLEYVSVGDSVDNEGQTSAILKEITKDTETNLPPISLSLDAGLYCPELKAPPLPAPVRVPVVVAEPTPTAPPVARSLASSGMPPPVPVPAPVPVVAPLTIPPSKPGVRTLSSLPTIGSTVLIFQEGVDKTSTPPIAIRFFLEKGVRFSSVKISDLWSPTGKILDAEGNWTIVTQLPHFKLSGELLAKADGYKFFNLQWKLKATEKYVYALHKSGPCETEITLMKHAQSGRRAFQLNYVGKLEEIYPSLSFPISFTIGGPALPAPPVPAPPAPVPVPSVPAAPTEVEKAEAKKKLSTLYPPTEAEILALAKIKEPAKELDYLNKYKKMKIESYAISKTIDLESPEYLYYKGKRSTITSFNDLKNKNLSLNETETWGLQFAKIVDIPEVYITTEDEDTGNVVFLRIFDVKYINVDDSTGEKTGDTVYHYGLVLPKKEAKIEEMGTTPWKFILLEIDDDDGEEPYDEETGVAGGV